MSRNRQKLVGSVLAVFVTLSLLLTGCGQSKNAAPSKKKVAAKVSPADQAAAQRGYILVGYPNPATGVFASLGAGADWVANQAIAAINKNGGIYIKSLGKKLPVRMKMMDTQSSATVAAQVTADLITKDKVNLLLVLYTPDVVNPVCAMAERYHVPTIALGAPIESWLTGGPYNWSYLAFFTEKQLVQVYMSMWDLDANNTDKVVGLLCPNDPDGLTFAKTFKAVLPGRGYSVVDPGRFPDSTNDFTAVISKFKQDHVDIVTGVLPPPVFATVWRQMHEQGFIPKMLTMGKALLMPADVDALGGNLPDGLTREVWWSPYAPFKETLTDQTGQQLIADWEKTKKTQGPATIGFDWAGWELVNDTLTRAQSVDPQKLVQAIAATDLNSVVGPIKFNEQHYALTPLVGGQWLKGAKWPWQLQIVANNQYPDIPVTAKMLFPMPK